MMTSLQKLCLGKIAENFEKYHFAFEDIKNEIPKRAFKFLQRQYSTELASELYEIGEFKEEYLDFLMNKYLKFLDNKWLRKSRYKKYSMNNIFSRLPNLAGIEWDCARWDITNDEILENVAKYCPKLVEINVSSSSITDDGIKYLCRNEKGEFPCPDLKKLHIASNKLTDEGLKYIVLNLPFLEEIQKGDFFKILYSLHKDDLPNLENARTYNITHLKFLRFYIPFYDDRFYFNNLPCYTDMLKICLKVCPRLKSLNCVITDKEQLNLFSNTCLEDLYLDVLDDNRKIDVNNFLKINGCNLLVLEVWNCIVSINILTVSCPKLRRFSINKCFFSGVFDDEKSNFQYLTKCDFAGIRFDITTNEALSLFLSCSPKLEELEFDSCHFTPKKETDGIIWSQCSLRYLGIFRCFIEMEIVKDILSNCLFLNFLWFDSCNEYDGSEIVELNELLGKLQNKPKIDFTSLW